jgi:lysophospholipase L1-like esterase
MMTHRDFAWLVIGIAISPAIVAAQTQGGTTPLQYTALQTPCRAVDTRVSSGPIAAGTSQSFSPAGGACNIPLPSTGPIVYALNVTVIPAGPLGYLSVWPTGTTQPLVSTLNSPDGRVKANAALAAGGSGGEISIYASNTTDLVLDVSGYFTSAPAAYVYVPVTPCRIVDTRISNGTSFGAPSLVAGQQRTFQLANSNCNLPATAFANGGAVSLNVTAVPIAGQPVSYVTVWGTSETEPQTPLISTLNAPTGTVTANAALVAINPSTSESVSVYSSNSTDLVLDVTGYFAPASLAPSGLSLYTLPPCRIIDTRESSGEFQGELTVPFTTGNNCSIPTSAQAFVVNATVVPSGPLGFLTLWPDGTPQPLVSTLNAGDGSVTSNMAIVSTTNGSIDAFASSDTQLILDVSGYFALPPGPTVVLVGDSVMASWITPAVLAANPGWVAQTSAAGVQETTAQILARLPAAIALHPNIIVIEAGTWNTSWSCTPPGDTPPWTLYPGPCQDILTMVQEIQNAGIYPIICTVPPWGNGPLQEQIDDYDPTTTLAHRGGINTLYYYLKVQLGYPNYAGMGKTDLYAILGQVDLADPNSLDGVYYTNDTTDGVNPDSSAAQILVQALQAAIAASGVGGAGRRNPVVGATIQAERVGANR